MKSYGLIFVHFCRFKFAIQHPLMFAQDTAERTAKFFKSTIIPRLDEGRNVLVVAHGNVLRCIIAHLAGLTEPEMLQLQVMYKILLCLCHPSSIADKCLCYSHYFFLLFSPPSVLFSLWYYMY